MWKRASSEDVWALWIGLLIFALSLGVIAGWDLLGWGVSTRVWLDIADSIAPVSKAHAGLPPVAALFSTYLFLLALMTTGAAALRYNLKRFIAGFSVIFWASYLCWLLGHFAYIAATPDRLESLKIGWSLGLTGEAGYILALLAGLILGNFFPGVTRALEEASRPEWFIKTAIVILGASLGVQAAAAKGLAGAIIFRGFAAIIEAYLIYWALVYFVARKFFRFSREWASPFAEDASHTGPNSVGIPEK